MRSRARTMEFSMLRLEFRIQAPRRPEKNTKIASNKNCCSFLLSRLGMASNKGHDKILLFDNYNFRGYSRLHAIGIRNIPIAQVTMQELEDLVSLSGVA